MFRRILLIIAVLSLSATVLGGCRYTGVHIHGGYGYHHDGHDGHHGHHGHHRGHHGHHDFHGHYGH